MRFPPCQLPAPIPGLFSHTAVLLLGIYSYLTARIRKRRLHMHPKIILVPGRGGEARAWAKARVPCLIIILCTLYIAP